MIGGGHSAANALLDLARLAETDHGLQLTWAVRSTNLARVFGGGADDQLPARGKLGSDLKQLVDGGRLQLVKGFHAEEVTNDRGALVVTGHAAIGTAYSRPRRSHHRCDRAAPRSRHDARAAPRFRSVA